MSVSYVLGDNREELIGSFHLAVIYGILNTWKRCVQLNTVPQEPDFVAGLVFESTPIIHSALSSVLGPRGISTSISSVFCHQTPQVSFDSNPASSCELGDILFAYVHTPRVGQPRRNAVLFQAKASSKQPYRIKREELDQLRLYIDWPDFTYTRSTRLNGQKRSVTPKTPHSGAQYLLIDDRFHDDPMSGLLGMAGTYPVGCCMPDEHLRDHNHLASELFNLFIFSTGRPFEDRSAAASKRDWSQVVWDLLITGVKKAFNRRNSGRRGTPRSCGGTLENLDGISFSRASSLTACSTVGEIVGHGAAQAFYSNSRNIPPDFNVEGLGTDDPEGGVSVVLIETSERESEEQNE